MRSFDHDRSAQPTMGPPWRIILNTVLIFFISQAIALAMVSLVYGFIYPDKSLNLIDSVSNQFFYILIAELLAAGLAIKLVRVRKLSLAVIGLGRRPITKDLLMAAGGFLVFFGLAFVTAVVINILDPNFNDQKQNLGFKNLNSGPEKLMAFVSLVLLPPIGEEILTRGYLFSGLRKAWRFWPAALITSIIFGLAHLELGNAGPLVWAAGVNTFLLSVVLCLLRERTGALYACMLVHMTNNLIAFGVHFK